MSVTAVRPLHSGRSGMSGADGKRTYNITYQVQTDDPQDGAAVVIAYFAANGIGYGVYYAYGNDVDVGAFCTSVVPRQLEEDRRFWEVVVTFEGGSGGTQKKDKDGKPTTNPLSRHPELRVGFAQFSEPAQTGTFVGRVDADDNQLAIGNQFFGAIEQNMALLNTANDEVAEKPYMDRSDLVCLFTFFESSYDSDLAQEFQDTINASPVSFIDTWWNFLGTWDTYTAKVQNITGEFIFEDGYKYWRNTYEIHVRRRTWLDQLPNKGFWRFGGVDAPDLFGGVRTGFAAAGHLANLVIQDARGFAASGDPAWLDSVGQPLTGTTPAEPSFMKYKLYKEMDFSLLNLVYTGATTGGGSGGQASP